jgi:predicted ATP-binding protein involved in virulence
MDFEALLSCTSLLAQNYKCFGVKPAGFETLRSINLIIGRNNSGKLALLDLVELACNNFGVDVALFHKTKNARILVGSLWLRMS